MNKSEISILLLRVFLGISFYIHGLAKFKKGLANTAEHFGSLGLPEFLAYAVAYIELFGGIALVFGLGSRIVSILFGIIMVGAILKVKLSAGFLGGYELDIAYLIIALLIAINGSKLLALDHLLFKSGNFKTKTT
ncbi:DoxX family protein [Schinkia azotoformans]|uniref:DoxX family protein n=1 Tax=Schinkia azotoformans TaxID=1454 RepID=UPI002DB72910|nr:DoxX family protein [Schinkia azotoformans]MEC1697889.1 DoxX family protein [Schinkia azotoformans]MEC1725117.1 DoxX family protein [Schinkia azotoformans]MEC1781242.1 DoxX family protein [Schinkia azotoformans]MED4330578.1 DoxX family protein [Schinkia azotoformans]